MVVAPFALFFERSKVMICVIFVGKATAMKEKKQYSNEGGELVALWKSLGIVKRNISQCVCVLKCWRIYTQKYTWEV